MTAHIAFFNTTGGIGKTSLVYHCAFMFAELGLNVLAVDLDPLSSLSMMALDASQLASLWPEADHPRTLYGALAPWFEGADRVSPAHLELLSPRLGLLVGDPALSRLEEVLSTEWLRCLEGRERAFQLTTAFWSVIDEAAKRHEADVVLLDVGPTLGAISRAALVASSHVAIPLGPDLFSLQGIKSMGPALRTWRSTWASARAHAPDTLGALPEGSMSPVGYVLMQHAEHLGRPVLATAQWQERLSVAYCESVLGERRTSSQLDGHQIQRIRPYRSLMPMAMDARKPMFQLTSADGAIGALQVNVQQCHADYCALVKAIAARAELKEIA